MSRACCDIDVDVPCAVRLHRDSRRHQALDDAMAYTLGCCSGGPATVAELFDRARVVQAEVWGSMTHDDALLCLIRLACLGRAIRLPGPASLYAAVAA